MRNTVRAYYSLTKPGVLYGNALTAAAGFLFASQGNINFGLFLATLFGTSFVIGSACVINNYLDQDIDKIMARTKKRPLITGAVSGKNAVIFGITIGVLGIALLTLFTNWLVVVIGIIGFVDYVVFYGMLSKRQSIHGTLVGSISGAAPILAGYVAVTGTIDIGALLVFAVLFFWQMPEFYSIAIYRRAEYKAAGVPVITVVRGVKRTKALILMYTAAFVLSTLALEFFNVASSVTYVAVMAILGSYWLFMSIDGLNTKDDNAWAKRMFKFSLIILLAFCFIISLDAWLP